MGLGIALLVPGRLLNKRSLAVASIPGLELRASVSPRLCALVYLLPGPHAERCRPDIALAVNNLQRRASAPRQEDVEALKQLIRYVKGTMNQGIPLGRIREGLIGYVDASYQDCEDGKSTEAFIFFYAGAPVSWNSRKEEIVARSSTSAEYVAFDGAVREAMWLHKIMKQMGIRQDLPITPFTDSDNAVTIMKRDNFTKTTKWIDARYHFVQRAVRQGIVAHNYLLSAF
ncbi:hypothetical protein N7535_008497 [Penicillium sp. DV-2018c]|nr:hypothetical protein N7535_008497 [Penicillium sp. DV-2018c]